MAVSFLSTVHNLHSIVPASASVTSAPRYPSVAATVHCSKIEADADNENGFKRRSVLTCFGATVGLELVKSSGTFGGTAEAADLIQRRQRSDFQSMILEWFNSYC